MSTVGPMRILTVCLGNICRSPTAQAAILEAAAAADLDVEVESAGTGDWHIGELPDERMRVAAAATGLDLDSRGRQVEAADLSSFDLVLAMDHDNLRVLESLADGDSSTRIELFRAWDPEADGDLEVPDPYYGGRRGFEEVVEICRRTARALVEDLAGA